MKLLTKLALVAAIAVPMLASCQKEEGKSAVAVTGVTVSPNTVDMTVGQDGTVTLTATVAPADASNKNVTWTVADSKVAAITPNGASCTVAAGAAGTTTITVTTEDGGKVATCNVTVKSGVVEPTFVSIDPETATVEVAGQVQLTASVFPADATDKSVTWASENDAVATVDQNGVVTGVAPGTVNITVTTNVGGKTSSCAVKVAGLAKLDLQESWFSTNAMMTYVSMNKVKSPNNPEDVTDTDIYGFGTPDMNYDLDKTKGENRLRDLGKITNMWDGDLGTCFHTNIDWGLVGVTWGQREEVNFGIHNVTMTFPSNYTKVRIVLTANTIHTQYRNSVGDMVNCSGGPRAFGKDVDGTMVGGFVLYWSADGEEFVKYNGGDISDGKVSCPDWGSVGDVTLEATEAMPSIAALRIESQKEQGWTYCETAFGIAELEVYAE